MSAAPRRAAFLRRSVRVTVAASVGFYPMLYAAGLPVTALYALFAPIAMGLLSAVPGSGRQQASDILRVIPPALAVAALGTLLAVNTWAATGGMLVIGFVLAFAAVAGPRAAGVGPGLQLFYILACFPPYAPHTLLERLAGLSLGLLLLAACEILLPDPAVPTYRQRLAAGLRTAAHEARAGGMPPRRLREAGATMRLSHVPPAERPAGAGRTDRALEQAGRAVRRLLGQLASLAEAHPEGRDQASATLLGRVGTLCEECARALTEGTRPPAPETLEHAMRSFQAYRVRLAAGPPGPDGPPTAQGAEPAGRPPYARPPTALLRRQSRVLALAESARVAGVALDIALNGVPARTPAPRAMFWYAELATPRLWARRVLGNVTLRSVLFQNAVRTALGLAAARLVAGSLDLTHGFWVLLVVLTLGRSTVGATWQAVRGAVAGNAAGAVVAGALLIGIGPLTEAYAVLLAPLMLLAFFGGPMLGIACTQGLFTLVVATAFAQISPVTWRLSEARMVDVVTGSVIGLLCGLLAWPAGARHEVRRAMAGLLRTCGALVPATAEALLTTPPGERTVPGTLASLHRMRLAEAAYAQYRTEASAGAGGSEADWHAVLVAADDMLWGAHRLPLFGLRPAEPEPPDGGGPDDSRSEEWTRRSAAALEGAAGRIAVRLGDGSAAAGSRAAGFPGGRPPVPPSVDLEVWIAGLGHQLQRIEASLAPPEQDPPEQDPPEQAPPEPRQDPPDREP
ncbi:FUSC family protein [Streptomyces sp. NBC_00102]|uniref:FUSC family protein n=1 Tax=Streptomyces sp. NBC_00102 TaxID=2975652 RepID=UPI00224D5C10|nr:FUSC family protein [Streptomyces sp. NBC_00102]MCX5400993.1 FUSC family protein [Streptomyces sp. NBC_00102]